MLRDLFSSRAIQAGLFFFVLVVGGVQLYSWHVRRTTAAKLVPIKRLVQTLENENKTHPAQAVSVPAANETPGFVDMPEENTDTPMSDEPEAVSNEPETLDIAEPFLPDDAEEETAETLISPYGFGPYPELPAGWPIDETWPCISADHELMARVEIKLAHQGVDVIGSIMENGLVYPMILGTVYVKWADNGRRKYISDMSGGPDACDRIRAIEEERGVRFTEADIPSDIKVLSYEEGGIDPYTFLDLP